MASIPNPPFKLSLVTAEWKDKSIKAYGDKAGLTTPFNCTEFVGKADWVFVKFSGKQHNFDFNTFYNACDSALGGAWSGKQLHIIFESDAQFVSKATNVPRIKLDRNFTQLSGCTLENMGHIVGRGGNGSTDSNGGAGGIGIQLASGVKVSINNKGIIGGGGGAGGGASWKDGILTKKSAGGGGAPFGKSNVAVGNGTYSVGGNGGTKSGAGGGWGEKGKAGSRTGGAAGKAINVSGGTITWITEGDIRGEVS